MLTYYGIITIVGYDITENILLQNKSRHKGFGARI